MIKRCKKCGYWWTDKGGVTNVCQECGERHKIDRFYDEEELVNELNKVGKPKKIDPQFVVINSETNGTIFMGNKKECEQFIKKHETIWEEMAIMEVK